MVKQSHLYSRLPVYIVMDGDTTTLEAGMCYRGSLVLVNDDHDIMELEARSVLAQRLLPLKQHAKTGFVLVISYESAFNKKNDGLIFTFHEEVILMENFHPKTRLDIIVFYK